MVALDEAYRRLSVQKKKKKKKKKGKIVKRYTVVEKKNTSRLSLAIVSNICRLKIGGTDSVPKEWRRSGTRINSTANNKR